MTSALIVDDEPFLHEMYRDILELMDVSVAASASDGGEAVGLYDSLDPPPTIVLMDHRMPGMSGLEASRRILEKHPDAKILFVSADTTVVDEALDAGAMGFLVKPFTIAALRKAISDVLDG